MLRVLVPTLLFALILTLHSSARADGGARVVEVDGTVWTKAPGASESRARVGQELEQGTRIRTDRNSAVHLRLDDGSQLRLRARTSIVLSAQKRQRSRKRSILLFFGRLWSKVTKTNTETNGFEVNTPNAVAGVRGTEFETAVGDDGSVRVRVSEGRVNVADGDDGGDVNAGQRIEGDEAGIDSTEPAADDPSWDAWRDKKRERARTKGRKIIKKVKERVLARKKELERLRAEQKSLQNQQATAQRRAQSGDRAAVEELRRINEQLAKIADQIADIGDRTGSQFGYVDHLADLASDPRFKMIGRKTLQAEAANLRRVKKMLDKMVAEGTDISVEAMDKMLDDYGKGERGTLKDGKGSSVDDLFGDDPMKDMR